MDSFSVANNTNIRNGCVEERHCTDILCLAVFLAFIGVMMGMTMWGYKNGDIVRLLSPFDYNGKICGSDVGYENYPNLYLYTIDLDLRTTFNSGFCVKTCPTKTDRTLYCPEGDHEICTSPDVEAAVYATHDVLNYCIPDLADLKAKDPVLFETW